MTYSDDRLLSCLEELGEFLAHHELQVLLITEIFLMAQDNVRLPTMCSTGTIDLISMRIPIEVKNCVCHYCVDLPPRQNIETTAIEHPRVLGSILLVSAYKPQDAPVLHADLDPLFGEHGKVILAGDQNCKPLNWGSL